MSVEEQINFMITSLEIAKEELEYARKYKKHSDQDSEKHKSYYESYAYNHRAPNPTLIRENLKTVARLSSIVAKRVKLTPYCNDITD